MHSKKATITEVAALAGVSIATVSHVINRTRYVSPELEEKVMRIVRETGYIEKIEQKEQKLKKGRRSIISGSGRHTEKRVPGQRIPVSDRNYRG